MIEKRMGKRFSKGEQKFFISPEEYEEFFKKTEEQIKEIRKIIKDHGNFFEWLNLWQAKVREELKAVDLPDTTVVCVDKKDHNQWRPLPEVPDTFQEIKSWQKHHSSREHEAEVSLSDFLVYSGHDYDSPEHINAQILECIEQFKHHLKIGEAFDLDIAFRLAFLLGTHSVLKRVYTTQKVDSGKGGKGKTNPWRPYGLQLLEKYSDKSQEQIWRKIPVEPDYDECGEWVFYKPIGELEGENYLVAENSETLDKFEIKHNSFLKKYLSKKNPKK